MSELKLEPSDRAILIELAEQNIRAAVLNQAGLSRQHLEEIIEQHPVLGTAAGAFVTLYVGGQLRGCLGEVLPEDPLAVVVARCANHTPRFDYRFEPIRPDELDDLSFKVSVLSPPSPLHDIQEIQLGTDGLIAHWGGHSGLLLPEVPVEQGWDRETFLKGLWRKAGIPNDVPLEKVQLERFGSQVLASSRN